MKQPRVKTVNNYIHSFEGENPVLLEMPHSGTTGYYGNDIIPHSIHRKVAPGTNSLIKPIGAGCDVSVPLMTGFHGLLEELKPYAIWNDLARVLCDTNREKTQVSDWVVQKGNHNEDHHGVMWSSIPLAGINMGLSDHELEKIFLANAKKIYHEPLSRRAFTQVMKMVYDPYHAQIEYFHEKIVRKFGFCIHVALHSMPSLSTKKVCGAYIHGGKTTRGTFDPIKGTLPDVILIHNDYRAANKVLVDTLKWAFEKDGLIVEDGTGPFLGDIGVTKKYGNPLRGVNIIGIEHVAHDTEPERHLGKLLVNIPAAQRFQKTYKLGIQNLIDM